MGQATIHFCDECSKIKGDTNHWKAIVVNENHIAIWEYEQAIKANASSYRDDPAVDMVKAWLICSDTCWNKALARWKETSQIRIDNNATRSFVCIDSGIVGSFGIPETEGLEVVETPPKQSGDESQNPNSSQHHIQGSGETNYNGEVPSQQNGNILTDID